MRRTRQLAAAMILASATTLQAQPAAEAANVFDIACASGGPAFARLVPLQLNRSALVRASFANERPFATFEFHATKTNLRVHPHVVQINRALVESRIAPHCVNERDSGITFQPNPKAYDIIERTHDAVRPASVSPVVDRMRVDNIRTFGHDDIAFMEARQQAFPIVASNATRYDPAFTSRRVIGAVVFILDGHLLHATHERAHLYQWDGREYDRQSVDVGFVTRGTIHSDTVQRRLVGKLGVNLPLSRTISSSAIEQPAAVSDGLSSPIMSASGGGASGAAADPRAIELHPSRAFERGGRDCGAFKTHWDIQGCFDRGSALLLVSPHAPKPDARFSPLKVIGAVVYPRHDAREALIVRWDHLLDEYIDTGYSARRPNICRTCFWEPGIQAAIRSAMEPAFNPVQGLDPLPYTNERLPRTLLHAEAAQLLQRSPDACMGLVPQAATQEVPYVDEGFTPPIPAIACHTSGVTLVWAYGSDDTQAAFTTMGAIPDGTSEVYFNAIVSSYIAMQTRRVSFTRVRPEDTAGLAAAVEVQEIVDAVNRAMRKGEQEERRAKTWRTVRAYLLPVLIVIAGLLAIVLLLRVRVVVRRQRRQKAQQTAAAKRLDDLEEIAAMRADLTAQIRAVDGVRRRNERRIAEILRKWGLR